jgi:hypothetical protein
MTHVIPSSSAKLQTLGERLYRMYINRMWTKVRTKKEGAQVLNLQSVNSKQVQAYMAAYNSSVDAANFTEIPSDLDIWKLFAQSQQRYNISACSRPAGLFHEFENALLDNFVNGVLLALLAWVVGILLFDLYFWSDGERRFTAVTSQLSLTTSMRRAAVFRKSGASGRAVKMPTGRAAVEPAGKVKSGTSTLILPHIKVSTYIALVRYCRLELSSAEAIGRNLLCSRTWMV